jgi:hypothetical protein
MGRFEPELTPGLYDGTIDCSVTDLEGNPSSRIISLQDDWRVDVEWTVTGTLVGMMGGKWNLVVFLERMGPGDDLTVFDLSGATAIPMGGLSSFSKQHTVTPGSVTGLTAGAYRIIAVLTSVNVDGTPGGFAGYDQGPILQFFEGGSI